MLNSDVSSTLEPQPKMHLQAMPQKKHRKSSPAVDVAVGSVTTKSLTNNAAGGVFSGGNGENYRTMDRTSALMALLTNQLGIGILSVPGTLKTLGLIPGVIFIIGMGPVAWYGGYLLYVSVCRYPHFAHFADMAKIVGGRRWGAVTGFFFVVLVLSTCASVAVTMSIALNTITSHGVRTVGFIGIACLVCWLTCVPHTAMFVARTGIPTCLSIIAAILTVMISLGIHGPEQAPDGWVRKIELFRSPSFREVFTACLRVIFAYAGHFTLYTKRTENRY